MNSLGVMIGNDITVIWDFGASWASMKLYQSIDKGCSNVSKCDKDSGLECAERLQVESEASAASISSGRRAEGFEGWGRTGPKASWSSHWKPGWTIIKVPRIRGKISVISLMACPVGGNVFRIANE